jgi:hypothetical protein
VKMNIVANDKNHDCFKFIFEMRSEILYILLGSILRSSPIQAIKDLLTFHPVLAFLSKKVFLRFFKSRLA